MKRILIMGQDSYIGTRLAAWLDPGCYRCDTLDMRGDAWKSHDFSAYDSVVLVAGIAHIRETHMNRYLFEDINHRMAVEAGMKARQAGVGQFVFFSSMSVYGLEVGRIHEDTPAHPTTAYGISKLAAESELKAMGGEAFHVAVLRPPMIYGPGCKGNYPKMSRMIRRFHVFPRVANERSMLYIDTLCGFLAALLDSGEGGTYFPQNAEYVNTAALARAIADAHGTVLFQPYGFGWFLRLLGKNGGMIGKLFGTLTYDHAMSVRFMPEKQTPFLQSIRETEAGA